MFPLGSGGWGGKKDSEIVISNLQPFTFTGEGKVSFSDLKYCYQNRLFGYFASLNDPKRKIPMITFT